MVLHCLIIDGTTVELFTDLRTMTERFSILESEGVNVVVTSSEI